MKCNNFFPYGVSYYRPVTPLPEHWEKDLKNIADTGMNTIRVSAFWSRIEKIKDCYDFSEFDGICAAAAKAGLKVVMTLYIVNMPEWMFAEYPDSRMVSAGGRVQYSEHHPDAVAGGWPGLCMDDDRVMDRVKKFVREITRHYQGNDTLLAFDVIHEPWEEPTQEYYIDSWKNAVYCYCPHSIQKFREWLRNKYQTLEGLNKAWSRCYSDWEQVQPPRNFGAYADWLDWRNFSVEAVAHECMTAGQEVKKTDPDRLTVNHTGGVLNAFSASSDAFALAETVDIPGMSNYSIKSPQDAGLSCDMTRCASGADGAFWVGETSGGSGPMFSFIGEDIERFFAFSMPWSKQIQRKHIWKMLSHGAKGILYWMWRPELYGCETAAMGFTDREGNPTPRVENAKEIADVIFRNEEFFLHAAPERPQAATLYNRNTSILEGYIATAKMLPGNAGLFANFKDLWSLSGVAKLCMENSLPMDYLNDSKLEEGALNGYRLLFLPYSICIGKKAAEAIREFVRRGGTVVADALCGYFTEDGWGSEVVPAHGLNEVFGCKVIDYQYSLEQRFYLDGFPDAEIRSAFVRENLSVSSGEVIGRFPDGAPAVIRNRYGEGTAVYFAAPLFMNVKNNPQKELETVLRKMLDFAGVTRSLEVCQTAGRHDVEARILRDGRQSLLVVMNHGSEPVNASVTIRIPKPPEAVMDAETLRPAEIHELLDGFALNVSLDALGVQLFQWKEGESICKES